MENDPAQQPCCLGYQTDIRQHRRRLQTNSPPDIESSEDLDSPEYYYDSNDLDTPEEEEISFATYTQKEKGNSLRCETYYE